MAGEARSPAWQAPGVSSVSAMIFVDGADDVMDFAKNVFGAVEAGAVLRRSDGTLWNVALRIGESTIMVSERTDGMPVTTAFLHIYVEDVDAIYQKALAHGAQPMMAPEERFYGERAGGVSDAKGNVWWVSTFVEALDDDELVARARAFEASKAEV